MQNSEASSTPASDILISGTNSTKRQRVNNFDMLSLTSPCNTNISGQRILNIKKRAQDYGSFHDEYSSDTDLLLDQLDMMKKLERCQYAFPEVVSNNSPREKYVFLPDEVAGRRIIVHEAENHRRDVKSEKIDAYCRETMCLWCYRIIDHFKLPREFVPISMSYVDRFLSVYECSRAIYKLTCMTALYIVNKIHGMCRAMPILPEVLAILSRGEFIEQDIIQMEHIILSALKWQYLNPPTANAYLQTIHCLFGPVLPMSVMQKIMETTSFLTEIAVCDRSLAVCYPSDLAVASVLVAIYSLSQEDLESNERFQLCIAIAQVFRINTSSVAIQEIMGCLVELYHQTDECYRQRRISKNKRIQTNKQYRALHKSSKPQTCKIRNFHTKKNLCANISPSP